ncbi:hypothetical protein LFZ25_26220 (plasmid) [Salmonella enterica subsp. enterica serovar Macclesfield str. S-1643]|uniref:Uncharacterized protein n=1 Tax=Salmonella enterica subsp. enterica serovar Macclesfield str. S-1643 TaxID=1242107 RepID=A0A241PYA1_SALET|nr:hypothetical protein LFZ25_26220 [Salmonella enterica subsp. enterica serovar Macclesfield str. S-1643]EAA5488387.1 hypothetical protein [Salmonella enterica subsp. enterica serovar Kouka]EAX4767741.1 hypothetical protein [Salmonella enterica]EDW5004544.1 hypothetical protein [Salmonella enterica subsp. enterica serovar Isangi]
MLSYSPCDKAYLLLLKSVKTSLFITGLFSFVPLTPGLSGVVRHPFEHNQVFPILENYLAP